MMLAQQQTMNSENAKGATKAQIRKALMSALTGGAKFVGKKQKKKKTVTFGFSRTDHAVFECAGEYNVAVVASRAPGAYVTLNYTTEDATAKSGNRYKAMCGELQFTPFQTEAWISIPIIDNDVFEEDEMFKVVISNLVIQEGNAMASRTSTFSTSKSNADIKTLHMELNEDSSVCEITILNDDMPGTLEFFTDEVYTEPGKQLNLSISRTHGAAGEIICKYRTEEDTAKPEEHFKPVAGEFKLAQGATNYTIPVDIVQIAGDRPDRMFRIIVEAVSPGVKFNPTSNGGATSSICDVVIQGNIQQPFATRCLRACFDKQKFAENCSEYAGQFSSALCCNGSLVDQQTAGCGDWFFHGLSMFWKVLFAFVPPPGFAGGWLCFWCALMMIGLVTAFVGDMAGLLGCCIGIPDDITAITLVALGTSLPDTFASKVAAQQNPTADDSIGNVTGSNFVNVFLGLGLPWSIGSLYWLSTGRNEDWDTHKYGGETYAKLFNTINGGKGGFMVPAGSLAFSVIIFTTCALLCIFLLIVRRCLYGGELGGKLATTRRDSFIMVSLWFVYIILSILKSLEVI